jgi:hypothetical protein
MVGQTSIRCLIASLVYLSVHGCTSVNGGAVELSWKLRPASGATDNFVDCDSDGRLVDSKGNLYSNTGQLTTIRLHWEIDDVDSFTDFKCSASHGVTTFELHPGEAFLWVTPVCDDAGFVFDAVDNTFAAPAPQQRSVIAGNTIDLGAVELVLEVSSCVLNPTQQQFCVCQ